MKHFNPRRKSKSKKIVAQLLIDLSGHDANMSREYFGAASKFLVPVAARNDFAPKTIYDSVSTELASFQKGFTDMNSAMMMGLPQSSKSLNESLQSISEANARGKRRIRDVSKRFTKLKKRTRKALRNLGVPNPVRGTGVFFASLADSYLPRHNSRRRKWLRLENESNAIK